MIKSLKKQSRLNSIPIFISKTYQMINNDQNKDIICWSQNGQTFIIKNITQLTTDILPKYFKHNNFTSFVRQLNLYGFQKIHSQNYQHIFQHSYFNRDKIQLLTQIKKKISTNNHHRNSLKQSQSQILSLSNQQSLQHNHQQSLTNQISQLSYKYTNLQNILSILIQQNKQIIMQNKQFAIQINQIEQKYRKKLQTLICIILYGTNSPNNTFPISDHNHKIIKNPIQSLQNNVINCQIRNYKSLNPTKSIKRSSQSVTFTNSQKII